MLTRTYRIKIENTGQRPEFMFFADKHKAWAEAQELAQDGRNEHVAYELVENNLHVLNSYRWHKGTHYDHTNFGANGETCPIPECGNSKFTPHFPSTMCKSGSRNHCTCDACF